MIETKPRINRIWFGLYHVAVAYLSTPDVQKSGDVYKFSAQQNEPQRGVAWGRGGS